MNTYLQSVDDWAKSTHQFNALINQHSALDLRSQLTSVYAAATLQERVQKLETLVLACNEAAANLGKHYPNYLIKIVKLQAQALSILKHIFDVSNNKELVRLLEKYRRKLARYQRRIDVVKTEFAEENQQLKQKRPEIYAKKLDEHLVEWKNKNKCLLPVKNFGMAIAEKQLLKVNIQSKQFDLGGAARYFKEAEREAYRIILHHGKFFKFKQMPNNINKRRLELAPYSTTFNASIWEMGRANFVIDRYGNMFAGRTIPGYYHHSSPVAGSNVFFAGLLGTNQGIQTSLGNQSGHYKPNKEKTADCLKWFAKRGALSNQTSVTVLYGDGRGGIYTTTRNNEIDISEIQQTVKKERHPDLQVMPFKTWKNASNVTGIFARRYPLLKEMDKKLLQYSQLYSVQSPQENIDLIASLLSDIKLQQQTHPASQRAAAINSLKTQLQSDENYWQTKNEELKQVKVDYETLSLKI